jgi:hypothetical protein
MAEPLSELKRISLFAPRISGLLAAIVATFPFVERLTGLLSGSLRYRDLTVTLASIVSFALIGSSFLKRRPMGVDEIERAYEPLPTGRKMLLVGATLALGYVAYADFLTQSSEDVTSWHQGLLMLWYLACFASLTIGFWQMAFRAYASRKKQEALDKVAGSQGGRT